jgi:multidrug efflux system membrane fusion protein
VSGSRSALPILGKLVGWGIVAAAVAAMVMAVRVTETRPRTDAAEIEAPVVHLSASVPGRIVEFRVENNAAVKRGETLFVVDPEPYRLRVEQARAEVRAAESEVAQGERNLAGQEANASVASEQIRRARDNLGLAEKTLERLAALLPDGYVSAQQVDQARTSRNDARISLEQALTQSRGARDVIGTLETRKAQLDAARATQALAERDLANTEVKAPFDGRVTGLKLAVGEWVVTGQALATLIDTARWEASANFRETDLAAIKVGNRATVFVMSDPGRAIEGVVEGVGWGVRSDEGANVLGLPIVSRSLNWVRVARRYPVSIRLIDPPEALMRIGASAVVIVGSEPAEHVPHPAH